MSHPYKTIQLKTEQTHSLAIVFSGGYDSCHKKRVMATVRHRGLIRSAEQNKDTIKGMYFVSSLTGSLPSVCLDDRPSSAAIVHGFTNILKAAKSSHVFILHTKQPFHTTSLTKRFLYET